MIYQVEPGMLKFWWDPSRNLGHIYKSWIIKHPLPTNYWKMITRKWSSCRSNHVELRCSRWDTVERVNPIGWDLVVFNSLDYGFWLWMLSICPLYFCVGQWVPTTFSSRIQTIWSSAWCPHCAPRYEGMDRIFVFVKGMESFWNEGSSDAWVYVYAVIDVSLFMRT